MKRYVFLFLALLCALAAFMPAAGTAAEADNAVITLADLAEMDPDSVFTMDQLLALLQETYALGYRDGQKAAGASASDERSLPALPLDGEPDYVLNTNSHKFHYPDCKSVGDISPQNREDFHGSRDELIAMGYSPCKRCKP